MTFRNWWRNNIHAPDPYPQYSRLDTRDGLTPVASVAGVTYARRRNA